MAKSVTCPCGHHWENAADEKSSSTILRVVCPICGAAVDLENADAPATIEVNAVTLASSHSAAAADAETLPPGPNPGSADSLPPLSPLTEFQKTPTIPGYERCGRVRVGETYSPAPVSVRDAMQSRGYLKRRSQFQMGCPLRCPTDAHLPDGTRATRKPRLLFRCPGGFLPRNADRQFWAVSYQLPPRYTRIEPSAAPGGSRGRLFA
jgi:hypothetical protein